MIASAVDWTQVLGDLIAIIPAIVAAIFAARIHKSIKTPSGRSIGELAEYAHDTTIANNMLLSKANGPTKPLSHEGARERSQEPPRVPDPPPSPAAPSGA